MSVRELVSVYVLVCDRMGTWMDTVSVLREKQRTRRVIFRLRSIFLLLFFSFVPLVGDGVLQVLFSSFVVLCFCLSFYSRAHSSFIRAFFSSAAEGTILFSTAVSWC